VHPANVIPEARDGVVLRITLEVVDERLTIAPLQAMPIWTAIDGAGSSRGDRALEIRVVPLSAAPEPIASDRRPLIEAALGDQVELLP
jgi:hypothetical protein